MWRNCPADFKLASCIFVEIACFEPIYLLTLCITLIYDKLNLGKPRMESRPGGKTAQVDNRSMNLLDVQQEPEMGMPTIYKAENCSIVITNQVNKYHKTPSTYLLKCQTCNKS